MTKNDELRALLTEDLDVYTAVVLARKHLAEGDLDAAVAHLKVDMDKFITSHPDLYQWLRDHEADSKLRETVAAAIHAAALKSPHQDEDFPDIDWTLLTEMALEGRPASVEVRTLLLAEADAVVTAWRDGLDTDAALRLLYETNRSSPSADDDIRLASWDDLQRMVRSGSAWATKIDLLCRDELAAGLAACADHQA